MTSALALSGAAALVAEGVGGWELSDQPYDRELLERLDRRVADQTFKQLNGLVIIRDGKLLVDRYYNGAERDRPHNPRSVGKTFASAVLGLALRDGHIESLDKTLADFYDLRQYQSFSEKKSRVTLEHLLTMTSGFDGFDFERDSPGNEENMYPQPDWVRWTLDLPMASDRDPGDRWFYFTAGIVVLGDILNRTLPGGLEVFADAHLFAPLGIRNYSWQHTPNKVANTAGGIQLTALDFAKFGQLYKDGGKWNGRQVLPEEWVEASLAAHADTVLDTDRYGYLWWKKAYRVADRAYPVTYASGNGGNKIFVFDQEPLVVVVTASAYGRRYMHSQVDRLMTEFVIPAVTEPLE